MIYWLILPPVETPKENCKGGGVKGVAYVVEAFLPPHSTGRNSILSVMGGIGKGPTVYTKYGPRDNDNQNTLTTINMGGQMYGYGQGHESSIEFAEVLIYDGSDLNYNPLEIRDSVFTYLGGKWGIGGTIFYFPICTNCLLNFCTSICRTKLEKSKKEGKDI